LKFTIFSHLKHFVEPVKKTQKMSDALRKKALLSSSEEEDKQNVASTSAGSGTKFNTKKMCYVVLENCPLEIAKVKDQYRLLNCDDHRFFLQKYNRTPENYRPDIVHQVCILVHCCVLCHS